MGACLELRNGARRGVCLPIRQDAVTLVGRALSDLLILDHPDVSPAHCLLAPCRARGGVVLIDAWSDTGTRVNGRSFTKGIIQPGDVVRVGPFELELVVGDGSPGEPAPAVAAPSAFVLCRRADGRVAPLPSGRATVVGRGRLADVRLDDPYISELHCVVALTTADQESMPLLVDLRSSNGTCLAGRPIHRAHVPRGQAITAGSTELLVRRARRAADRTAVEAAVSPDADPVQGTTELLFAGEPGSRLLKAPNGAAARAGSTSYAGFFGFDDLPFRLTADPDYFFGGRCHGVALTMLAQWLRVGAPLGLVCGPPGSGKSLLLACAARELAYRRPLPVVMRPGLEDWTLDDLLTATLEHAARLHPPLPDDGGTPLDRWRAAVAVLRRRNVLVAFLVDDAEAAGRGFLDHLAVWLDTPDAQVASRILLAGSEALLERVAGPPLQALVGLNCTLETLAPDEVAAYVARRLTCASGRRRLPFTRHAVELIAEHSRGIPRLINTVADAALFAACRAGQHRVDGGLVAQAVRDALGADPLT